METIKKAIKKFSSAVIHPVFYLAVVGIMLSISVVLTLDSMPEFLQNVGVLMNSMMNSALIGNLSIILCTGLAGCLAKKEKANAAILGLMVYLMYIYTNNAFLTLSGNLVEQGVMGLAGTGQAMVLGLQVTDLNVLGGMALGCITGYVFNKLIDVRLPEYLGIYGGPRLALLVMVPIMLLFSVGAAYFWPPVAAAIGSLAEFIKSSGSVGVFVYGFLNRFLIPTGLHHFMWMPFMYTEIGGQLVIDGVTYSGAQNIFYAMMPGIANGTYTVADPSIRYLHLGFSKEFIAGGIALAMVMSSRKENRKAVTGMVIPVYLVSALSGITEAFDFTILLASPILWTLYGLGAGISEAILHLIGSQVNNTYAFIELFVMNLPLPLSFTKIYIWLGLGIVFFVATYFISMFLIKQFNIMTPGRDVNWADEIGDINEKKPTREEVIAIIEALGGKENIAVATHCITRFRTTLKDVKKADIQKINKLNPRGSVVNGDEVHVIIGANVLDFYDIAKEILRLED